jgi:hypothetical protein
MALSRQAPVVLVAVLAAMPLLVHGQVRHLVNVYVVVGIAAIVHKLARKGGCTDFSHITFLSLSNHHYSQTLITMSSASRLTIKEGDTVKAEFTLGATGASLSTNPYDVRVQLGGTATLDLADLTLSDYTIKLYQPANAATGVALTRVGTSNVYTFALPPRAEVDPATNAKIVIEALVDTVPNELDETIEFQLLPDNPTGGAFTAYTLKQDDATTTAQSTITIQNIVGC